MKRFFFVVLAVLSWSVAAQDAEEVARPWSNSLELGAAWTSGNTETNNFNFKNVYQYKFEKGIFSLKAGALRAETTDFTFRAVGNEVVVEKETRQTDEKYSLNLKYEHEVSKKFFWFTGLDWEKNEFAGIKNRTSVSLGVGNVWADSERTKFRTDYGVQYTNEEAVFEPAGFDDSYGSIRVSYKLEQKIGANADFSQDFVASTNFDETSDFRVNLGNKLSTGITKKLALSVGLDFIYDHQPAVVPVGNLTHELEELDTVFTTSLVINF